MQFNLEIGKLYTVQGFLVLKQSNGDWRGVRDGEILMPIEIIHGKQDYTRLSIKLLSENGMIGFSFLSYCTYTIEAFDSLSQSGFGEEISFEIIDPRMYPTRSGMPHPFYGSAYFTHKENYHVIPEDLKIHYGDLFNYVSNLKKGIHNYTIEDGLVMTNYSSTVSSISKDILNHEANIMKQVFEKHGLTNIKYTIPN
jgi:hypothetical protein